MHISKSNDNKTTTMQNQTTANAKTNQKTHTTEKKSLIKDSTG